jgi:DNA helicase-2/ATP-dependent DNA helicase PcrA
VKTFSTGNDEAEEIARHIRKSVQAGERKYRDHAVFVRVNALSRAFETAFVKERVPFQIVRGLAFFERKENRDVLAYLRLITNPRDDISFLRVVNEPARGIGKVSLEHLRTYAERRELSLLEAAWEVDRITEIKGKASKGIRDFTQTIRELMEIKDSQPDELIRQTLDKSGYRKMLRDSRDPDDQERLANIEELITAASQFTKEDSSKTIGDFLENITLASDIDSWNEQQDTVSIMTLHAAKGLEFPVVFIVAMEQGILPHERSLSRANEVEEERRLAFVGMTRAKQELHISRAHLREFRGQTLYAVPSMFLSEIPTETIEGRGDPDGGTVPAFDQWRGGGKAADEGWTDAGVRPIPLPVPPRPTEKEGDTYKVGMNVRHEKYGEGKIVDLTGSGALRKVKIRFRTAGEKTFVLSKVKLEVL